MSNYIIPLIVLYIVIYGFKHNINIYDAFIEGIKEGLITIKDIFPTIFAMTICINILLESNIINDFSIYLKTILNLINYPSELIPLIIMKPISGSSTLIIFDSILKKYGADTIIGRTASILTGTTDTTIYIIGLYTSIINIKKTRYALITCLSANILAIIFSYLVVKNIY